MGVVGVVGNEGVEPVIGKLRVLKGKLGGVVVQTSGVNSLCGGEGDGEGESSKN